MPETIEGGQITAEDLLQLMQAESRGPVGWHELPSEEAAIHLRSQICPDSLVEELEWHIREIQHVNANRHVILSWPLIGRLLRDQHEINRLVLISLEKSVSLSEAIESEFGRLFSRFRNEDRSFWIQRFRYLGRHWNVVSRSIRQLREAWEDGRNRRFRLRSRAGQAHMSALIDEALRALSEIVSTLVGIFDAEVFKNSYTGAHLTETVAEGPGLDERVESSLWHAAEGRAVRIKWEKKPRVLGCLIDHQRPLNRIYMIALEENSAILQELAQRISHPGYRNGNQESAR